MTLEPLDDLIARLERERLAADRIYNDALTALDRALAPAAALPPAPSARRPRAARGDQRALADPAGRIASPSMRSLKGRLAGFVWRLVGPPLQRQAEFNAAVTDHLNRTAETHDALAGAAVRFREAVQAELQAIDRFHSLLLQYLQTVTAYVDTKDRSLGGPEIRNRLGMAEQRLQAIKRELERPEGGSPQRDATCAGGIRASCRFGDLRRLRRSLPRIVARDQPANRGVSPDSRARERRRRRRLRPRRAARVASRARRHRARHRHQHGDGRPVPIAAARRRAGRCAVVPPAPGGREPRRDLRHSGRRALRSRRTSCASWTPRFTR